MKRLFLVVMLLFIWTPANAATYAVTVTGVTTITGMIINGGGSYAGMTISSGSTLTASHISIGNVIDDAINVAESASISDTAVWCGTDGDCTITIAADKTLTGSTNAVRVSPTGAGTDSWTGTIILTACPYLACSDSWNFLAKRSGPLLRAGSSSSNIGYYQNMWKPGGGMGGFGFGYSPN